MDMLNLTKDDCFIQKGKKKLNTKQDKVTLDTCCASMGEPSLVFSFAKTVLSTGCKGFQLQFQSRGSQSNFTVTKLIHEYTHYIR